MSIRSTFYGQLDFIPPHMLVLQVMKHISLWVLHIQKQLSV